MRQLHDAKALGASVPTQEGSMRVTVMDEQIRSAFEAVKDDLSVCQRPARASGRVRPALRDTSNEGPGRTVRGPSAIVRRMLERPSSDP